jgi:hypothetical protein
LVAEGKDKSFTTELAEAPQRAQKKAQAGVPVPHGGGLILEFGEEVVEGFG